MCQVCEELKKTLQLLIANKQAELNRADLSSTPNIMIYSCIDAEASILTTLKTLENKHAMQSLANLDIPILIDLD